MCVSSHPHNADMVHTGVYIMKIARVKSYPKCSVCCTRDAKFDVPIAPTGQWGYLCTQCYTTHAANSSAGFQLVLKPEQQKPTGETRQGTILSDLEEALWDGYIDVECPKCHEVRSMEVDSAGYTCECGTRVVYDPLC